MLEKKRKQEKITILKEDKKPSIKIIINTNKPLLRPKIKICGQFDKESIPIKKF